MMTILTAVAATALTGLTAAPVAVLPAAATVLSNPGRATPAPDRRYCIKNTPTGSRIDRKICKTRAQWEAVGTDMTQFDR